MDLINLMMREEGKSMERRSNWWNCKLQQFIITGNGAKFVSFILPANAEKALTSPISMHFIAFCLLGWLPFAIFGNHQSQLQIWKVGLI